MSSSMPLTQSNVVKATSIQDFGRSPMKEQKKTSSVFLPGDRLGKVQFGAGDQGVTASVPGNLAFSPAELWPCILSSSILT